MSAAATAHQDRDFYVTGESYAGHYVPAVAHRVWAARKAGDPASAVINLVGLAIGNGLTDPGIQYGAYADYALQNKLIDSRRHDAMQLFYPICRFGVSLCNSLNFKPLCMLSLEFCQMAIWEQLMLAVPGINVYDITKKCEGALCYDFSAAAKFLNSRDVRAALGVGDRPWQTCSPSVYQDMMGGMCQGCCCVHVPHIARDARCLPHLRPCSLLTSLLCNIHTYTSLTPANPHPDLARPRLDAQLRQRSARDAG